GSPLKIGPKNPLVRTVIFSWGYWLAKADSTGTVMATSPIADNLMTKIWKGGIMVSAPGDRSITGSPDPVYSFPICSILISGIGDIYGFPTYFLFRSTGLSSSSLYIFICL